MSKTQKAGKKERAQKSEPIVVAQIMGKWVGGGVESVIMNYYRHIDRNKIQFDFICDEDSTNIPYDEIENLGGHVILCPPYQKLAKYLKFLKQLFREKKYRIVHSNINTLSVFPLYAAKKAGVPVRIAHSHSTSNPREWKKNLMKNALRPFSKVWATDYFACSELAGRYLFGDKAFDKGKVKIIHNAIDTKKFKYDPEARKKLREEIGIADDDFVIGHIGRFVEQKNHRFLIDVFAEVKKKKQNARLVLVGQGPLREEIEQKVKDLGLEKDVFFLGQRRDTNKLYSVFDVFCLPSLYEGLPVVGVEAQANGVSCVFSDRITKEMVVNKNVELIDIDNNPCEIAKTVSNILKRTKTNNWPLNIVIRSEERGSIIDDRLNAGKRAGELMLFYEGVMTKHGFSIIIPCYNVEKYVEKCIDSIIGQDYEDYEIIAINDGSTDKTLEILNKKFRNDSRITIVDQQNKGLSEARNIGMSKAKKEYIVFVDSDDYFGSEKTLSLINEGIIRSNCDILVYGNHKVDNDMGTCVCDVDSAEGFFDIKKIIKDNSYKACAWDKVVKRSLIEETKLKFIPRLLSEDIDWCAKMLRNSKKIYYMPVELYMYRQRCGSITKSIKSKNLEDIIWQIEKNISDDMIINSYLAYEYSVLLGMMGARNIRDNISATLKKKIFSYKYLLRYDLCNKVKIVRWVVAFVGVKNATKILGYFVERKNSYATKK